MSGESGEKTEEPTDKKIEDSRKKGQVWNSRDLTGVFVFLAGLGVLKGTWPMVQSEFSELFAFTFDVVAHPKDLDLAMYHMGVLAFRALLLLSMPVLATCAILGGLVGFLQVGPLLAVESVMPKVEKLNPIEGLKNMFSKKQAVELLKSSLKISVTGYVVFGVIRDAMGMVASSVRGDTSVTLEVLGELIYRISLRVGLLFTLFAIFDVWWQRRTYYKDLMMTKDEIKREYKESEGDPHHKYKRREFHQEIIESAQMDSVRSSDVVVTNPTHLAVALKYDREKDQAPKIVCKGAETRAELIRELAKEAKVPIMRNVPLAHALHRLDVGQDIPEELYDAVAEVLNFVYQLRQQTMDGLTRGSEQTHGRNP